MRRQTPTQLTLAIADEAERQIAVLKGEYEEAIELYMEAIVGLAVAGQGNDFKYLNPRQQEIVNQLILAIVDTAKWYPGANEAGIPDWIEDLTRTASYLGLFPPGRYGKSTPMIGRLQLSSSSLVIDKSDTDAAKLKTDIEESRKRLNHMIDRTTALRNQAEQLRKADDNANKAW